MRDKAMCKICSYRKKSSKGYGYCKVFCIEPKVCWAYADEIEKNKRESNIKKYKDLHKEVEK